MQCPRCRTEISARPDPGGSIVCPGCGARLMTRAHARSATSGAPAPSNPGLEAHPPSATIPASTAFGSPARPVQEVPRSKPPVPAPSSDTPVSGTPSLGHLADPAATDGSASLEDVLAELRAIREAQSQILSILQATPSVAGAGAEVPGPEVVEHATLAPVRTRRRKSLLLIDDDPATREAAVAELGQAQVPVRAVADGNAGIQAIAEEKPDVIAIELDVGGSLAGKDVINMIKATMEWVDIPIILYTRLPLESQKEARTVHGADDLVLKRSGPAALVSRAITAFRHGA